MIKYLTKISIQRLGKNNLGNLPLAFSYRDVSGVFPDSHPTLASIARDGVWLKMQFKLHLLFLLKLKTMRLNILKITAVFFLVLIVGFVTNAQVQAVNLTYYFPGPAGTYTAAAAVQTSSQTYNQQVIGSPTPNIINYAPSTLFFNSVPIPSPMPMNYCRVVVGIYNGTVWHFGYSDWTAPDASGNIYPNVVKIPTF